MTSQEGGGRSILFIIRDLEIGGAQRQLIQLARGLASRAHRVSVLVFYSGGALEEELEGSMVQLLSGEKRNKWDVVGFLRRVARIIRAERPDIVHGYLVIGNAIALACRMIVPSCRVVWGVRASSMVGDIHRLERLVFHLTRRLSRYVHLVIANSQAGARHLLSMGVHGDRIRVVPNGVDLVRFRSNEAGGQQLRRRWKIPAEAPLVGIVARLHPMKGHETLLRAVVRLSEGQPGLRVVAIGDGSLEFRTRLVDLAEHLSVAHRVVWVGRVADIAAAYSAFDVTCVPSLYGEGMPNAALESLACGTPCVVTDVGDSAALCEAFPWRVLAPGDPEAMATALDEVLRSPASEGDVLRDLVRSRFSLEGMLEATEALLWEVGGTVPVE